MTDVTRTLARYVVQSKFEDLPANVVHEARRALLHWIGCALGGCRDEAVQCALEAFMEHAGQPRASILGRNERADIVLATFLNAMSADALGFSDTHLKTVLHPGGAAGPAVLALAEREKASGPAFLHAFALGIEVACRIGLGVYEWHYGRGWHITGTVGTFGAAAAAGKLLALDEARMTSALGIAATQAAGLREGFGSMCKSLNPGRAAQNGLTAALLAAQGFTSTPQGIEGRRGFAHVLGEAPDLDAIVRDLGSRHELLANAYKPFPCGVVIHPLIDGCITLATQRAARPSEIAQVELRVNPLVLELASRAAPESTSEAKLSAQHSAAAALVRRRITEREFAPECIRDAEIVRLRSLVALKPDATVREDEAHVVLRLAGGQTLTHHVEHAAGSEARPMSDSEMESKVRGLAEPVLAADRIERLIEAVWRITESDDAATLARLATPAP